MYSPLGGGSGSEYAFCNWRSGHEGAAPAMPRRLVEAHQEILDFCEVLQACPVQSSTAGAEEHPSRRRLDLHEEAEPNGDWPPRGRAIATPHPRPVSRQPVPSVGIQSRGGRLQRSIGSSSLQPSPPQMAWFRPRASISALCRRAGTAPSLQRQALFAHRGASPLQRGRSSTPKRLESRTAQLMPSRPRQIGAPIARPLREEPLCPKN